MYNWILLPIYSGASIAHCEGLRYIAKNMQEFHPSVILCVPLLLENLHKNIIKNMNKTLPDKYKKKTMKILFLLYLSL